MSHVLPIRITKVISKLRYSDQDWFLDQINRQLGKYFDRTHRSLCTSDRYPLFCDFLNEFLHYQEVIDEKHLHEFIIKSMNEYNYRIDVVPIDLVLFRDAIDHICRITRVISQPRGYILLIGIGNFYHFHNTIIITIQIFEYMSSNT